MQAYFTYNNKKSSDFDLMIEAEFSLTGSEKGIEFVEVAGVDGEFAMADYTRKNVNRTIPCLLLPNAINNIEQLATDISEWLDVDGWQDLTFSREPNYVYKAIYHESYDLSVVANQYHKLPLTFTLKPYKYLKNGLAYQSVTNGQTLKNEGKLASKPLIKITGTGDITLKLGDQLLVCKSIDKGIIVDVQADTVTTLDGLRPAFDKVYSYPLPQLAKGNVAVSWTGDFTVEIMTRWCSRV